MRETGAARERWAVPLDYRNRRGTLGAAQRVEMDAAHAPRPDNREAQAAVVQAHAPTAPAIRPHPTTPICSAPPTFAPSPRRLRGDGELILDRA